jgi:hypothetical protein
MERLAGGEGWTRADSATLSRALARPESRGLVRLGGVGRTVVVSLTGHGARAADAG